MPYTEFEDTIFRCITDALSCSTLEQILDTAHSFLGNPIVLYDHSHRVRYCSDENDLDDGMWIETRRNRRQSFETVKSFISAGMLTPQLQIKNYNPSQPTIINPNPLTDEKVRRLAIGVMDQSLTPVGWLVIFEHKRRFNDSDKGIIYWLSKILTPYMALYFMDKAGNLDRISNVMVDILNAKTVNEDFAVQLKIVRWNMHKNNWVLAVYSQGSVYPQAAREYLCAELNEYFDDISDFIYNGYLIVVLAADNSNALDKSAASVERVLKEISFFGAVSPCFTNIVKLRQFYKLATNCLTEHISAPNRKSLAFFDEYAINILCRRASRYFSLDEYCHPAISELQKYDRENNTEFLNTLRAFVMDNGNLKSAAYALNIHRNTLVYRIDRIKDILNLDVYRQDVLKKLYMSFIIFDSNPHNADDYHSADEIML